MQTSLVFLGVMSFVIAGTHFAGGIKSNEPVITVLYNEKYDPKPAVWEIAITGSDASCKITKTPASFRTNNPEYATICNQAFSGFNALGRLDTDRNGNITAYSTNGEKLALFMESESGFHESVWPQYPLMTLAKIN